MNSTWGLVFSLGLLSAIGSGAGSISVLIGAAASGVINAGGSFGQFIFAPILQKLIQVMGWMGTMWTLAAIVLTAFPLIRSVTQPIGHAHKTTSADETSLWLNVKNALADPSYLLLHAVFFTCGFHIAFLVTHLPGEVNLCGLPPAVASWSLAIIGLANIFGSLFAGASIARYRSKYVLFWMYSSRADHRDVSGFTKNRPDLLYFRSRAWLYLARHRTADCRHRWQAVRRALPWHTLWIDTAFTPDRRLPRRLAGRSFNNTIRRLYLNVAGEHCAGKPCSGSQSADSRS